jgi:hypothetical protein
MKKTWTIAAAILLVLSLLCTGALAKGNGPAGGGGGQQQGGNSPQNGGGMQNGEQPGQGGQPGGQMGGMNIDVDAVTEAIATLTDATVAANLTTLLEAYETAAAGTDVDAQMQAMQALQEALTAAGLQVQGGGMSMNGSQMNGTQYGRYLDTDKIAAAIAALTDTDVAANLTALLATYQTAVQNQNQEEILTALQALFTAMNQTQAQPETQTQAKPETQTQNQPQGDFGSMGMNADECRYLDTDAVAAAIASLTDSDVAANLTTLLDAYNVALIGDDSQTLQSALTALMTALSEAGIA